MGSYECKKGWVVVPVPDENDNDVMMPFFVQVRDSDVHWNENNIPEKIRGLVSTYGTNVSYCNPAPIVSCDVGAWKMQSFENGMVELRSTLPLSSFEWDNADTRNTKIGVNLPFPVHVNDNLSISIEIISDNTDTFNRSHIVIAPISDLQLSTIWFYLSSDNYSGETDINPQTGYPYSYYNTINILNHSIVQLPIWIKAEPVFTNA